MQSTLKQKQTDDPHDIVVVPPDVAGVAPADDELANLLHDAARHLSDAQARTGSGVAAGAAVPPVDTTFRPSVVNDVAVPGPLRSIGRGAMRAFTALLLAACMGAAGIAWEFWGDAAQQMIAKWTPQFALTSSLPAEKPALPEQPSPPAVQAEAATATATLPQPAAPAQAAAQGAAPAAAVSAESAQLLQSMARDLATVRQETEQLKASIEQLRANQQQISRDVAKASEQSLRPRVAAPAPRPVAAPVRKPMPPPPPLQAAAAPALPQAAAPSAPRQAEPLPPATAPPSAEALSVPRPPMPLSPGVGSFSQ